MRLSSFATVSVSCFGKGESSVLDSVFAHLEEAKPLGGVGGLELTDDLAVDADDELCDFDEEEPSEPFDGTVAHRLDSIPGIITTAFTLFILRNLTSYQRVRATAILVNQLTTSARIISACTCHHEL